MEKPPLDLFDMAAGNAGALQAELDTRLAGASPEDTQALARFAGHVRDTGRIAINMRQSVVNSFLTFGEHRNIYEWAILRAKHSKKTKEEILREKLDTYYERRIAFDRCFEDGERFRYGALNIGGLGANTYGEYCVVFKDHLSSTLPEVAYLRSDSLKTYLLPGPVVDEARVQRETAPHSHRQCLAALKHAEEIPGRDERHWPVLLCSESDYVEAVLTSQITPEDVETIRMSRTEHDRRHSYAFEEFRGTLSKDERELADAFAMMFEHLDQKRIHLVDENDVLMEIEDAPPAGVGT